MPEIADGLFNIMGNIGIGIPQNIMNSQPFGIALFYKEPVDGDIYREYPISVLVYHRNLETHRTYASFLKRDEASGAFIFMPNLSGLNNMISSTNFGQLNTLVHIPEGDDLKEVLVLLDNSKRPITSYPTIFQLKLDNENWDGGIERPMGGGGGGCSNCNGNDGHCEVDPMDNDKPVCKGICNLMVCADITNAFSQEEIDYIYWLRDSVLMKTEKGQQIIDDYYYSGEIMRGKISFSLAWKVKQLFGINLFERFSRFFILTAEHGEEILINDEALEIVTEICTEAKDISNDARFQSIITKTENDLDKYYNQPFSNIRPDYE